ncbi:MAG: hypothetical protein K0R38_6407 [Polyangiaceae bacterium]|jgi:hypothetical protein|nr:hypothetical protein [Polyangiaceae bacterium]
MTEITNAMWRRPVDKKAVVGIHGTLFYELKAKAVYYPTKRAAEAVPFGD